MCVPSGSIPRPRRPVLARWCRRPLTLIALAMLGFNAAWAQAGKYGVYHGTVKVSGTAIDGDTYRASYAATIEIAIPVDDGSKSSAVLVIGDVKTPSAKITITQYEARGRDHHPGADGKITSWKCSLGDP